MVSLVSARRRAEQFATAVDGRAPVDDLSAELHRLVDVVDAVRSVPAPAPRPEFSTSLRERLMAEAETALAPVSPLVLPPRRSGARERRLTAAAAVFTLVGGTAGIAAAAQQSLPGEALYPIKRGIEDAQLRVQSDADSRGRTYLDQARARLDEAERLVDEGASSTAVAETVDEFVVQSVAGADLLLGSYADEQSTDDVEVLREFAADTLESLQVLAETAPADIQDELARAAVVLQQIDQQASATCSGCSDLPVLEMPVLMSQAAEISRAMEAMRTRQVSNDHPAMAVRLPSGDPAASSRSDRPAPSEEGGSAGASGGGTGVGASGGLPVPQDPQQALEELDRATGGLLGRVTRGPEETVDQLQDGLRDELEDAVGSTLDDPGVLD